MQAVRHASTGGELAAHNLYRPQRLAAMQPWLLLDLLNRNALDRVGRAKLRKMDRQRHHGRRLDLKKFERSIIASGAGRGSDTLAEVLGAAGLLAHTQYVLGVTLRLVPKSGASACAAAVIAVVEAASVGLCIPHNAPAVAASSISAAS